VSLWIKGATFQQIAAAGFGIATASGAWCAVSRALARIPKQEADQTREAQRVRLQGTPRVGTGAPRHGVESRKQRVRPEYANVGVGEAFRELQAANLPLNDTERLIRVLTNRERPVQLVVAGKAHPQDEAGQQMV
jgi:hypothetical protein